MYRIKRVYLVRMIGTQGEEKVILYDSSSAEKVKQQWQKDYRNSGWRLNQIRPVEGSELETVIGD